MKWWNSTAWHFYLEDPFYLGNDALFFESDVSYVLYGNKAVTVVYWPRGWDVQNPRNRRWNIGQSWHWPNKAKSLFNSTIIQLHSSCCSKWMHWLHGFCLSKEQLFKTNNRRRVKMQCRFLPTEGVSHQNFSNSGGFVAHVSAVDFVHLTQQTLRTHV